MRRLLPMTREGCLICGIIRGFSVYPTCKQEAKLWGITLVENKHFDWGEHMWGTFKQHDGPTYGIGLLEDR